MRETVCSKQEALTYRDQKVHLWSIVRDCYARLASQYEAIVIEGAESAAKLNLRDRDLVN